MSSPSSTLVTTWSHQLWGSAMAPTYDAILRHPFLTGLADGTLAEECFTYYLAQDAHYLDGFARALAVVGSRAETLADAAMFARHAAGTADVELSLHADLLDAVGVDAAALAKVPASPTTTAYASHLLATAHSGSFVAGVAAVLPCYWIYARVGDALVERGSPQPRFQRWIDTYAGEEFGAVVAEVLALTDRIGVDLPAAEEQRAHRAAQTSARYEWMFWDAAHRLEGWPL